MNSTSELEKAVQILDAVEHHLISQTQTSAPLQRSCLEQALVKIGRAKDVIGGARRLVGREAAFIVAPDYRRGKAKYPPSQLLSEVLRLEIPYVFLARALGCTKMYVWNVLWGYLKSERLEARIEAFLQEYRDMMDIDPYPPEEESEFPLLISD